MNAQSAHIGNLCTLVYYWKRMALKCTGRIGRIGCTECTGCNICLQVHIVHCVWWMHEVHILVMCALWAVPGGRQRARMGGASAAPRLGPSLWPPPPRLVLHSPGESTQLYCMCPYRLKCRRLLFAASSLLVRSEIYAWSQSIWDIASCFAPALLLMSPRSQQQLTRCLLFPARPWKGENILSVSCFWITLEHF